MYILHKFTIGKKFTIYIEHGKIEYFMKTNKNTYNNKNKLFAQ